MLVCVAVLQAVQPSTAWKDVHHLKGAHRAVEENAKGNEEMKHMGSGGSNVALSSSTSTKEEPVKNGNTLSVGLNSAVGDKPRDGNHAGKKSGTHDLGSKSGEVKHGVDYKPGEGALNTAYFNTLVVIFAILVLVLTLVSDIEMRIQAKDEFMRQAVDISVRQVALMSLVTLSIYIVMHTDLANQLDVYFTRELAHIEVFDTLMQISFFLFCFFFVFCIYIALVTTRNTRFMRKVDEADVVTTAKEFDFVKGSLLHCCSSVIDKTKYLVNRMEFSEAVKQRGYSDNSGCFFMEYLRASFIQVAMTLLKISRLSLFVALAVLLVLRCLGTVNIFRTIYVITGLNTAVFILVALRVFYLESQLYPLELSQYLLLKLSIGDAGEGLQPVYKGLPHEVGSLVHGSDCAQYTPSNAMQSWLCGDRAINAHENLFWLKQNGPIVLQKTFETLLFCHLMILSVWSYCLKSKPSMMFDDFKTASPLIATLVIICLVPKILYSLVIVTRCGSLIDFDLLDKVLRSQKNENAKNTAQLIDALAMEAVRFAFEKDGDVHWRKLLAKQKALPEGITNQLKSHWDSMRSRDGHLNLQKSIKYLQSHWGSSGICDQQRMKEFVKQFMRRDAKRMNLEEFMVFGYAIKNMIVMPLEEENLMALFEQKFEIPWRSPCGIDVNNFDTIISKLRLKWIKSSQRRFLEFIGGGTVEGLSPEYLIRQLDNFQQACQKDYFSTV
ncbi:uncharacterized protein BcabD6B2_46680 [Babesia caballi]|uniref:Membrane protein, putative n=1 Tax=Babesia caballi TaxID=5871 RepID=A0AAV4LYJ7_BABCB|nr:membrane protein, putative [Babesia caballi]